ncbi:MAG: glycogen debranching protein, partial [Bacteroidota bacterium]
ALLRNGTNLAREKATRFNEIQATAKINVPDEKIVEMYDWIRWNTDWLIREVPEQGRGLSAGIADFPWWFGADNCYALQGLLSTGRHDEVLATIDLLIKLSESVNDNGRIMHEASTNGVVFNEGNLNETPHFIWLLWEVYRWTGDRAMLERYYPNVKKGLDWLTVDQDKDQNGYPDGLGMMEIHGLHSEMIDVVVYTQQAFEAADKMAKELDDDEARNIYRDKAAELKAKINSDWWVEADNSYADFQSSKEEAIELIEAAIVRSDTIDKPWAIEELEARLESLSDQTIEGTAPFVVHHNWVVNTPVEMNIAEPEQAKAALETARKYTNRFGTYVTGIDRDENSDQSSGWKSFSYVGAVMTLPTGVQAVAEANYGNTDEVINYMHMLHNSFGYALPGSMYEVSPDYGQMVQAWNIYGVAVPLVNHLFGIKPIAHEKKIVVAPALPDKWGEASIENVVVGNTSLDFSYDQNSDTHNYRVNVQDNDWTVLLIIPVGHNKVKINGEIHDMTTRKNRSIIIQSKS